VHTYACTNKYIEITNNFWWIK